MPEPVMGSLALRLAAVLVLVAANAFFVAAEFALVAARRTRIEEMIRRGDRKAKTVQQALQDLYRQLSAAQLGITVASILLGYVAEDTVAHLFREWFAGLPPALDFLTRGGIASVVAVAIISFLHVVFGEQAPKAWAITYPERTSRWIARPLILFSWITRPFTDTLNWSANRVVRLLGIRGTTAELERIHSPEEIRMLVAQSRRRGGLDAGDARMLEGVFEFSEKTAREVMTPRTDMVALPLDLTLEEAADQVAVAGRSRYPVYRESLDDIVGLVHAKDILAGVRSAKGGRLPAVLRPAVFVPGTREVEDVLADMKRQKIHLAIVLDEFGGTAGLVTMEDLLEEIVGPIYDEYDRPVAAVKKAATPGAASVLAGSTPLRDVNDTFGLELDVGDYTTLDGKLLALRYDFTASVARLAATKLAERPTPLRLCYSGAVFRQDPERANGGGRPREILQVGAELLGDAGIAADVEVLRLALELVRRASPKEYQVNLGHAGALAPALDALPPEERTRVRRLIDRKDAAGLATAAPGSLTELPFIIGRREALDRAARVAPDARVAIDRLREIDAALADEERRHVVYDFGEVRGLDYYTGMHFEIFVSGAGSAVGAGGRYDDLMGRFGRPLPAVGLALDLDGLAEAAP